MKIKATEGRKRIAGNFISLTILQIANYLLPLIVLPFLVRILGSEKFGLVMFAQSIATFLIIAVDFGFEISGTREISLARNQKAKTSQIFSDIIAIKFVLIIIWFLVLFFIVELIPRFKENSIVYYLSFGTVIGNAMFPVWFFQGVEKMKFITAINILSKFIFTALIFIVIRNESDYYLVPAFNSIGFIVSGFLGLIISLRHINYVKPKFETIKLHVLDSYSLFIGKFATNMFTTCNVLILGLFADNTLVGVYSSMEKLILAIKSLYSPLYQALFPWLADQDPKKRTEVLKKMAPIIFAVGLSITLLILFFGKLILTLIYDNDLISNYSSIFKILSFIAVFSGLNMLFVSLYFPAAKMYKIRMRMLIVVGSIHFIISLVLVKFYNIYGAAVTVVFTEFLLLILGYYFFKKHLNEFKNEIL